MRIGKKRKVQKKNQGRNVLKMRKGAENIIKLESMIKKKRLGDWKKKT